MSSKGEIYSKEQDTESKHKREMKTAEESVGDSEDSSGAKESKPKTEEGGAQKRSTVPYTNTIQSITADRAINRRANKSGGEELEKKKTTTEGNESKGAHEKLHLGLINFRRKGLLLAAAVVACIAVIAYFGLSEGVMKSNSDPVKGFGVEVDKLQSSFTNQTDRFWKIVKSRGLAHLQDKDPLQPLVFILAAPPAAHKWVDCLAIKLAEKLDPGHQRALARIYGEKEKGNPPDTTKKTMDNFLKEKFEAGHRVALIHHLELLPPPSPLLFYSYCDDQNAPHKNVAIIFTVHMPVEPSPSLSPKKAEESVEEYLSGEVWAKLDKSAVAALLSRIAAIVVLMNGESSGSAKELCSHSTH